MNDFLIPTARVWHPLLLPDDIFPIINHLCIILSSLYSYSYIPFKQDSQMTPSRSKTLQMYPGTSTDESMELEDQTDPIPQSATCRPWGWIIAVWSVHCWWMPWKKHNTWPRCCPRRASFLAGRPKLQNQPAACCPHQSLMSLRCTLTTLHKAQGTRTETRSAHILTYRECYDAGPHSLQVSRKRDIVSSSSDRSQYPNCLLVWTGERIPETWHYYTFI